VVGVAALVLTTTLAGACSDGAASARSGGEASFEVVRERAGQVDGVVDADLSYREVPVNGWGIDGTVEVEPGADALEVLDRVYAELARYGEDATSAVFVVAEQDGARYGIDGPLRPDESYPGLTAAEVLDRYPPGG
jgi:hypothetical protein